MGLFTLALIDYGSGNLRSAEKALQRAAAEAGLACQVLVTDRPEQVRLADRVVLPGVGAFADCKAGLLARPGWPRRWRRARCCAAGPSSASASACSCWRPAGWSTARTRGWAGFRARWRR
jgi:hypothetical protein